MRERLLGVETEYGFALLDARGSPAERERGALSLVQAARLRFVHLPDAQSAGIYLSNAGRLYVDAGAHPEFSTPECTTPDDVVRFVKAGHRIVADSAAALVSGRSGRARAIAFLANVDPRTHQTWGTHDSIMHAADVGRLPEQLIPHLVSRVIYSGAGGFNARAPGIHFTLSPRVWHLERVISHHSTELRGIFHTKNEPLAGGGSNRLHILCGESVWSDTALWLRIATTALIVAVIEAGYSPAGPVRLHAPLDAMQLYASDPTCRAVAKGRHGLPLSALAVQRHYLAAVESQLHRRFMPPWAADACARWRDILDRLEQGPPAVATTLDWAIKLTVFAERATRHGIPWHTIPAWNHVAGDLSQALRALGSTEAALSPGVVADPREPVAAVVKRLKPFMRGQGLSWDAFDTFLALRDELLELDLRFGQLGETGIFGALDRAGVLTHAVPGVDAGSIAEAMHDPPGTGRAHLRGTLVRRLSAELGSYRCSWDTIWDSLGHRHLDLSNPFATTADWQPG
jgi:proteasome accessory factor A